MKEVGDFSLVVGFSAAEAIGGLSAECNARSGRELGNDWVVSAIGKTAGVALTKLLSQISGCGFSAEGVRRRLTAELHQRLGDGCGLHNPTKIYLAMIWQEHDSDFLDSGRIVAHDCGGEG